MTDKYVYIKKLDNNKVKKNKIPSLNTEKQS